jgi:hypothetical protein
MSTKRSARFSILFLLVLPAVVSSSGCYQERVNQFSTFATAGSLYVQNFHKLILAAGSAMIAADSATLISAGNLGTPPDGTVAKDDQLLAAYLTNLSKIDAHATALGSYFDAVSRLTDKNLGASMATSANGLLDSIAKLNPEIAKVKFAGKSVGDYVNLGVPLVVTAYKVRVLDEHLKKAAPVIDQALALQESALDCIGDQMKASLGAALQVRERTAVIDPYNSAYGSMPRKPLPSTWNSDREVFLRAKVTIDSLESAKAAIKSLRTAYQQLVTAKTSPDLSSILDEIDEMGVYVAAVESSKPATSKQ